jgi:hypothetical protein
MNGKSIANGSSFANGNSGPGDDGWQMDGMGPAHWWLNI